LYLRDFRKRNFNQLCICGISASVTLTNFVFAGFPQAQLYPNLYLRDFRKRYFNQLCICGISASATLTNFVFADFLQASL